MIILGCEKQYIWGGGQEFGVFVFHEKKKKGPGTNRAPDSLAFVQSSVQQLSTAMGI